MSRPEFELLGRSGGKVIVRPVNGPRIYLTDEDFEAYKESGILPENTDQSRLRPPTVEERLSAIEQAVADIAARIPKPEPEAKPAKPKASKS